MLKAKLKLIKLDLKLLNKINLLKLINKLIMKNHHKLLEKNQLNKMHMM
jgi:hypothetical protein